MDDMESKLGAILGNPALMQQIMAMAQNFGLGILAANAGRSIPGSVLTRTLVAATVAPVCPGVAMASIFFSLSSFARTVIDESRLLRSETADCSDISQTVGAWTNSIRLCPVRPYFSR